MLRTALTPRWLGLLCLVIAVNIGFGVLGRWQLDVARETGVVEATQEAAAKPPTPLTQVIAPDGAFPTGGLDRSVTLVGTYAADKQLLVTGRRLGDQEGFWVVTPLAVEGASGRMGGAALIPVLRGFVTDAASAPAPRRVGCGSRAPWPNRSRRPTSSGPCPTGRCRPSTCPP